MGRVLTRPTCGIADYMPAPDPQGGGAVPPLDLYLALEGILLQHPVGFHAGMKAQDAGAPGTVVPQYLALGWGAGVCRLATGLQALGQPIHDLCLTRWDGLRTDPLGLLLGLGLGLGFGEMAKEALSLVCAQRRKLARRGGDQLLLQRLHEAQQGLLGQLLGSAALPQLAVSLGTARNNQLAAGYLHDDGVGLGVGGAGGGGAGLGVVGQGVAGCGPQGVQGALGG